MKYPRQIIHHCRYLAGLLLIGGLLLSLGLRSEVSAQSAFDWNFENGDLSGWTAMGDVAIIGPGIDPQTDSAMEQVAQGQQSLRIGDEIAWGGRGNQFSSVERTVLVPDAGADTVLQFSYAVVANDPPHAEIDKPFFVLEVRDLTTNETLPIGDFRYSSRTADGWFLGSAPEDQGMLNRGFGQFSGDRWVFIPWRHEVVNLEDRIGHQLQIKFTVRDCNPNAHAAYGYLDNIHVGPTIDLPAVPVLLKTPEKAGAPPEPSFIQSLATYVETNGLWPWCLLLPFLLALAGLLYWFFKRQTGVTVYKGEFDTSGSSPSTKPRKPPISQGDGESSTMKKK